MSRLLNFFRLPFPEAAGPSATCLSIRVRAPAHDLQCAVHASFRLHTTELYVRSHTTSISILHIHTSSTVSQVAFTSDPALPLCSGIEVKACFATTIDLKLTIGSSNTIGPFLHHIYPRALQRLPASRNFNVFSIYSALSSSYSFFQHHPTREVSR